MAGNTRQVINMANSIVGVSILSMPFCFKETGIVLGIVLILVSGFITKKTCMFLIRSAIMARRRSYEFLAFHVFGVSGKLFVELCMIFFLIGICISFHVVMGDLAPAIVARFMDIENSSSLRCTMLIGIGVLVILPLCLLRNLDNLASMSACSIMFYFFLITVIFWHAFPNLLKGNWIHTAELWRPAGALQILPIMSLALACQSNVFEIYDSVPDPDVPKMRFVVNHAVNLCSALYISVGFLGYVAFIDEDFSGNIIMSFPDSELTEGIKVFFAVSLAISFPLMIFPCRTSIHSLVYRRINPSSYDLVGNYMPESRFKAITLGILFISLVMGILIPNIEFVLGLLGSSMGMLIALILPAILFIKVNPKESTEKMLAQSIMMFGIMVIISGTYLNLAHIYEVQSEARLAAAATDLNLKPDLPLANVEDALVVGAKLNAVPLSEDTATRREPVAPEPPPEENSVVKAIDDVEESKPNKEDDITNTDKGKKKEDKKKEKKKEETKEKVNEEDGKEKRNEKEKENETLSSEVKQNKNLDTLHPDAIKKEEKENEEEIDKADKEKIEKKQEEILQKMEVQHQEQQQILEEQKKILQELKEQKTKQEDEVKKQKEEDVKIAELVNPEKSNLEQDMVDAQGNVNSDTAVKDQQNLVNSGNQVNQNPVVNPIKNQQNVVNVPLDNAQGIQMAGNVQEPQIPQMVVINNQEAQMQAQQLPVANIQVPQVQIVNNNQVPQLQQVPQVQMQQAPQVQVQQMQQAPQVQVQQMQQAPQVQAQQVPQIQMQQVPADGVQLSQAQAANVLVPQAPQQMLVSNVQAPVGLVNNAQQQIPDGNTQVQLPAGNFPPQAQLPAGNLQAQLPAGNIQAFHLPINQLNLSPMNPVANYVIQPGVNNNNVKQTNQANGATGNQPPAQQFVVGNQPSAQQANVVNQPPVQQPVVMYQSLVQQPAGVNQPVVANQPAVVSQPAVANQPVIANQPAIANQPIIANQPAIANQPVVKAVVANQPVQQPIIPNQPGGQSVVANQSPAQPMIANQPALQPVVAMQPGGQPNTVNQPIAQSNISSQLNVQSNTANKPVAQSNVVNQAPNARSQPYSGSNPAVSANKIPSGDKLSVKNVNDSPSDSKMSDHKVKPNEIKSEKPNFKKQAHSHAVKNNEEKKVLDNSKPVSKVNAKTISDKKSKKIKHTEQRRKREVQKKYTLEDLPVEVDLLKDHHWKDVGNVAYDTRHLLWTGRTSRRRKRNKGKDEEYYWDET